MEYGLIAVAAFGVISGFLLKLRHFLVVVGIVLVASIGLSIFSQASFFQTASLVVVGQIVLQLSYIVGVKIAVISEKFGRRPHVL